MNCDARVENRGWTGRRTLPSLMLLCCASLTFAADNAGRKAAEGTVFREPFTLELQVDQTHIYEEAFGPIPFVHEGAVYLFKDDEFGLNLDVRDNAIRAVRYQPELAKADVTLKFTQAVEPDGSNMMVLEIHNNTKNTLNVDALMSAPGGKGIAKTRILPVQPGLSGYESWPHPIIQLVLQNIRTTK